MVAEAAKAMRTPRSVIPAPEPETAGAVAGGIIETTIFRGPYGVTGATREIALKRETLREGKRHGWLEFLNRP